MECALTVVYGLLGRWGDVGWRKSSGVYVSGVSLQARALLPEPVGTEANRRQLRAMLVSAWCVTKTSGFAGGCFIS